jgi:diadenosine tetraphosphatase ApaH/serine/threonine PP2A family protein phosphatase
VSVRIAVLSDIHGNLEALAAVLADLEGAGASAIYSLGDIVGYGPSPAECIEVVRARAQVSLAGNHDAGVVGLTSLEDFNEFARWALEWTAGRPAPPQIEYLRALPYVHRRSRIVLAHASPVEPELWHYIHGPADLGEPFAAFAEQCCFVGHSHRPGIYALGPGRGAERNVASATLQPGRRYLVNAGSVGQPRDRDPRACYALLDTAAHTVELRRVAYPVGRTQEAMREAGIPAFLVDRLAAGV